MDKNPDFFISFLFFYFLFFSFCHIHWCRSRMMQDPIIAEFLLLINHLVKYIYARIQPSDSYYIYYINHPLLKKKVSFFFFLFCRSVPQHLKQNCSLIWFGHWNRQDHGPPSFLVNAPFFSDSQRNQQTPTSPTLKI